MKKKFILILFVFIIIDAHGQEVKPLELIDCLTRALQNDVEMQTARFNLQKSEFSIKESRSYGLPQLNASGKIEDFFEIPVLIVPGDIFGSPGEKVPIEFGTKYNCEVGATATQILYNQTYFVSLKLAKTMHDFQVLNFEQTKNDVIYNLSKLYYVICITRNQREIVKGNLQRLEKLYSLTKELYENDLIRKVDLDQVDVQKTNLETNYDNLQLLYKNQLDILKYHIGLGQSESIQLDDSILYKDESLLQTESDVENRTEFKLMEKHQEIARTQIKLAKSTFYPTLTGYANYTYQAQSDETDFFQSGSDKWFKIGLVGVSLNYNIFSGFERRTKIQKAKIELEIVELQKDESKKILTTEYMNAQRNYSNSLLNINRQKKNMDQAKQVFQVQRDQYRESIISMQELLLAESELSKAEIAYLNALYQKKVSELEILRTLGNLEQLIEK